MFKLKTMPTRLMHQRRTPREEITRRSPFDTVGCAIPDKAEQPEARLGDGDEPEDAVLLVVDPGGEVNSMAGGRSGSYRYESGKS